MPHGLRNALGAGLATVVLLTAATFATSRTTEPGGSPNLGRTTPEPDMEQLMRGRLLVISHACGDCHGGYSNPDAPGWLAGAMDSTQFFKIGPFVTRPRNITPDNKTGIGRFSERQLFNALRFGLRPGETPDVEITSMTPGEGNFPANPKYLAPPMPWPAFRYMSDQELRDIAAYLKHGVKPVENRVADSDGPPDFWASTYTEAFTGTYPVAPFPASGEMMPMTGSGR